MKKIIPYLTETYHKILKTKVKAGLSGTSGTKALPDITIFQILMFF